MALFFADLVREASWDVGAGDLTLGGALPGHRRFADAVPVDARFHYCIAGVTKPDEWETGEGAIGGDGKLVRAPLTSSANDQPVDFSPGLKTISLTVAAAWYANMESDSGADLAVSEGGTGASTAAGARANLGIVPGIDVEPHSSTLTALAALDEQAGLVEQTGTADFAKRDIGVGSASALPTRADADARYQPLDADLSAIAATVTTSFGRALLSEADAGTLRATAGLGTAATRDTGTSGAAIPLLDGTNTWSALQAHSADIAFSWASAHNYMLGVQFSTSYENSIRFLEGNRETRIQAKAADDTGFISFHTGATPSLRATITNTGLAVAGSASISLDAAIAGDLNIGSSGQFQLRAATHAQIFSTGHFEFRDYASGGVRLTISDAGVISDKDGLELGYKNIPRVTSSPESGRCLAVSAGFTLTADQPAGTTFYVYNDSASGIAITQGPGLILRLGGSASTGNRALAARGFATIWYNGTAEAIVSGAGVS